MPRTLTPAERVQAEADLAAARRQLQSATTGGQKTQVRYGDQEYRTQPVDVATIRARIAELEADLGIGGRARARRVST